MIKQKFAALTNLSKFKVYQHTAQSKRQSHHDSVVHSLHKRHQSSLTFTTRPNTTMLHQRMKGENCELECEARAKSTIALAMRQTDGGPARTGLRLPAQKAFSQTFGAQQKANKQTIQVNQIVDQLELSQLQQQLQYKLFDV